MAQVKPVNKKQVNKYGVIALIVAIAIMIGFIFSLVANTGVFFRAKDGVKSDNFEVNASMMEYFSNSMVSSFYSNYYYYILLGYLKFDTSTPYSKQELPSLLKDDEKPEIKTYYDYFTDLTTTQVTKILKYCEAARVDSEYDYAKAEQEANTYATETIASLKEAAKKNSTDFTSYVRQNFGEHVNKDDLYNCLVLEHLASDYSEVMYDRIYDGMTDERKDEYFKANLHEFVSAKYLTFNLSSEAAKTVNAKDYITDEYTDGTKNPKYLEAVEKAEAEAKEKNEKAAVAAKELIDKLAKAENAEQFKEILLKEKYEENFKAAYDAAIKDFAEADKPAEKEYLELLGDEELMNKIISAVINEKDDIEEDKKEDTDSQADETKWEKAKKALPKSVITKLKSVINSATKTAAFYEDKTAFEKNEKLNKFLFAGVKEQFGIDKYEDFEKFDDKENAKVNDYLLDIENYEDNKDKQKIGAYSYTVYFVIEEAHRNETILRDVGHILFKVDTSLKETDATKGYKTQEEAKAAAEKLLEEIKATAKDGVVEKDVFETFGKDKTHDSNVFYDGVDKEQMVEEFEEWLFAAEKKGEVGLVYHEATSSSSGYTGYHIMWYGGEHLDNNDKATPAWKNAAHDSATNEDLNDWYEALKFTVTVNTEIFKEIFG